MTFLVHLISKNGTGIGKKVQERDDDGTIKNYNLTKIITQNKIAWMLLMNSAVMTKGNISDR